jgi:hypothetical protein
MAAAAVPGLVEQCREISLFHALGPHPEEQAFAPEGEGLRLEGWPLAPSFAAILRDASLRDAPQDEDREDPDMISGMLHE